MRWFMWVGVYLLALSLAWLFIVGATIKARRMTYDDES